jgi:glycosyltransferase involved in cell wall biosynthesis
VLLPAHNDEAHVGEVVGSWADLLNGLAREHEVIVVDDGSTDHTAELVEGLTGRYPAVRLLRHEARRGFGAALRTGLAEARYPLVAYTPCGGQYRAADLPRFLRWIDEVDLVAGYRVDPAGRRRISWADRVDRWLARRLFALRLRDPGCEFVLARRSIFRRIPIQSDGSFAHAEILAKANFLGALLTEVPVSYQPLPDQPGGTWWGHLRSVWPELRRLYTRPDFGPPVLPEKDTATPAEPPEPLP